MLVCCTSRPHPPHRIRTPVICMHASICQRIALQPAGQRIVQQKETKRGNSITEMRTAAFVAAGEFQCFGTFYKLTVQKGEKGIIQWRFGKKGVR